MGPYFERNGIYPVFVTWQTGWLDTLGNALEDEAREVLRRAAAAEGLADALVDATDRMLEGAAACCRRARCGRR